MIFVVNGFKKKLKMFMKQEDKEILLKDLCARLPYGVKAYVKNWSKLDRKYYEDIYDVKSVFPSLNEVHVQSKSGSLDVLLGYYDYDIKPYLCPLSSMTEEQINDCPIGETTLNIMKSNIGYGLIEIPWRLSYMFIDWCNKNHFDYRGLIPMGMAIDATGLNIY